MKILITGVAGFIGMHLAIKLMKLDFSVVGIDNLNNYYDLNLKLDRLENINLVKKNFLFVKLDLNNKKEIKKLFEENNFDVVINLAAQAGVRYSLDNPTAYIESNISGF